MLSLFYLNHFDYLQLIELYEQVCKCRFVSEFVGHVSHFLCWVFGVWSLDEPHFDHIYLQEDCQILLKLWISVNSIKSYISPLYTSGWQHGSYQFMTTCWSFQLLREGILLLEFRSCKQVSNFLSVKVKVLCHLRSFVPLGKENKMKWIPDEWNFEYKLTMPLIRIVPVLINICLEIG